MTDRTGLVFQITHMFYDICKLSDGTDTEETKQRLIDEILEHGLTIKTSIDPNNPNMNIDGEMYEIERIIKTMKLTASIEDLDILLKEAVGHLNSMRNKIEHMKGRTYYSVC